MGKISWLRSAKFVPAIPLQGSTSVTPKQDPSPQIRKIKHTSLSKRKEGTHIAKMQRPPITFTSSNLSEAKTLFNSISTSSRTPPDTRLCNALLQSYSSISTLRDSISLLRHMTGTHPSFTPDRSSYHILLAQACKSSNSTLSPVHDVLNLMTNNDIPPDGATTDITVRALCVAGRQHDAVELVKEMSLKHSRPDLYTFNFLVKCLCKISSLSTVYNFINEMRKSFEIKPDLVTYTILIDNVCTGKNLREATRLLKVLNEEGFKADAFVYNTIMKGYCLLDQSAEVIGVFKKMQEEGVEPDLVSYNTLIFGLSKTGRVVEARKFLDVMTEKGHLPDSVTYTSLMNGMCRQGKVLGALGLLEEMKGKGCSPNACTYNTLLHGLCKSRLLERGMELYGLMKSSSMKLETAAYATLVRVLCQKKRIAEAYEVFDYAVDSKSLKDVAAYTTLESILSWLKKAKELGRV